MPGRPRRGSTSAATARSRRLARLRTTALPTLRLAVNPTRTRSPWSDSFGCGAACRISPGVTALPRAAATRRKSARVFSLARPRVTIAAPRPPQPAAARPPPSGREALAALGAPRRQHPTAADRRHSGAKAMAALADELAGLVSALHGANSDDGLRGRAEGAVYGSATGESTTGGVAGMTDEAVVEAANLAAREWAAPAPGAIRPGSDAHKVAFCRMLLETHNPYRPSIIDWPRLEPDARDRLVALPIWDMAVQTEGKARIRVLSYADRIGDPLLRQAVELDGFEEGRHKEVLSNLVAAYGMKLEPEPDYPRPRHPEWAFMTTGASERIDSFFAFALFAVARRSGFFPPELVDTFEPVMQEEARHILFFVNWLAWHRRNLKWWHRPWFWAKILGVWIRLVRERLNIARGFGGQGANAVEDNNFTLTGSKAVSDADLSVPALLDICLVENDRRLAGYDPRLLRPLVVPLLVRFVRRFMRAPQPAAALS